MNAKTKQLASLLAILLTTTVVSAAPKTAAVELDNVQQTGGTTKLVPYSAGKGGAQRATSKVVAAKQSKSKSTLAEAAPAAKKTKVRGSEPPPELVAGTKLGAAGAAKAPPAPPAAVTR